MAISGDQMLISGGPAPLLVLERTHGGTANSGQASRLLEKQAHSP